MNMKAVSSLIGISILGAILLAEPISAEAQAGPCACKDKADLLNQLYRANAATNSAQFLLQAMGNGDHGSRNVSEILDGPNPEHVNYKEMIDEEISDDVNMVDDPKAGGIYIKTDASGTCEPNIIATSACLKSLAAKTAPAHKSFCEAKRTGLGRGTLTVYSYLNLLRQLYTAEITEILKLLHALPRECKPYDWVGLITYDETTIHITTIQDTPTVTETGEDIINRKGMIRLNGNPNPFSTWEAGGKYSLTKTSKSWKYCTATDRRNDKRTEYATRFRIRWDNTGTQAANIEVTIDEPDGGRAVVSFRVPPIKVSQKGETTDILTGGCPKEAFNNSIPINNDSVFDSSPVSSSAPYFKAEPERLSGTDTKIIPNGGAIKVTFNLYRIGNPLRK